MAWETGVLRRADRRISQVHAVSGSLVAPAVGFDCPRKLRGPYSPSARKMTNHPCAFGEHDISLLALRPVVFFVRVSIGEQKWVTLAERRAQDRHLLKNVGK